MDAPWCDSLAMPLNYSYCLGASMGHAQCGIDHMDVQMIAADESISTAGKEIITIGLMLGLLALMVIAISSLKMNTKDDEDDDEASPGYNGDQERLMESNSFVGLTQMYAFVDCAEWEEPQGADEVPGPNGTENSRDVFFEACDGCIHGPSTSGIRIGMSTSTRRLFRWKRYIRRMRRMRWERNKAGHEQLQGGPEAPQLAQDEQPAPCRMKKLGQDIGDSTWRTMKQCIARMSLSMTFMTKQSSLMQWMTQWKLSSIAWPAWWTSIIALSTWIGGWMTLSMTKSSFLALSMSIAWLCFRRLSASPMMTLGSSSQPAKEASDQTVGIRNPTLADRDLCKLINSYIKDQKIETAKITHRGVQRLQGRVASDGNCYWRSIAKQVGAGSWHRIKKSVIKSLKTQQSLDIAQHAAWLQRWGSWVDELAFAATALTLHCTVKVITPTSIHMFSSADTTFTVTVGLKEGHFYPVATVELEETNNHASEMLNTELRGGGKRASGRSCSRPRPPADQDSHNQEDQQQARDDSEDACQLPLTPAHARGRSRSRARSVAGGAQSSTTQQSDQVEAEAAVPEEEYIDTPEGTGPWLSIAVIRTNLSWRHAFAGVQEGWTIKMKAGSQIIALIKHFARKWKVAAASIMITSEGRNLRAGYIITEDMACTIRVDRGQGGASSSTSPDSVSPPSVYPWHRERLPPVQDRVQHVQHMEAVRVASPTNTNEPNVDHVQPLVPEEAEVHDLPDNSGGTRSATIPFEPVKEEEKEPVPPPPDHDGPAPVSPVPSTRPCLPTWCLTLPSLYTTPPAAQRRKWLLRIRGNPNMALQVEEGICQLDYARSLRFWSSTGEIQTGRITSDDEAEMIDDADLQCGEGSLFGLRGGGDGQKDDKKKNDEEYNKILNLVYHCLPEAKRDALKLLVRGVPGLVRKLGRANGEQGKIKDIIQKAAAEQGVAITGAKQNTSASSGRSPSRSPSRSKQQRPQKSWKLTEDGWNCGTVDFLVPGKPGIAMVESADKATELYKARKGYEGILAVISPNYAAEVPRDHQSEIFFDAEEMEDDITKQHCMMRGILIQLGTLPATQKTKLDPIVISKKSETTAVLALEALLDKLDPKMKEELNNGKARKFMADYLQSGGHENVAFDLWKQWWGKDKFTTLVRLSAPVARSVVECSGKGGVFWQPLGKLKDEYAVIWLKGEPAEDIQKAQTVAVEGCADA